MFGIFKNHNKFNNKKTKQFILPTIGDSPTNRRLADLMNKQHYTNRNYYKRTTVSVRALKFIIPSLPLKVNLTK